MAPIPKVPDTEPNVSAAIKRDPCCETNFDGGGGGETAKGQGSNIVLDVENLVKYIRMNEGCVDV